MLLLVESLVELYVGGLGGNRKPNKHRGKSPLQAAFFFHHIHDFFSISTLYRI